jgi:S1-C subfamily serine protease
MWTRLILLSLGAALAGSAATSDAPDMAQHQAGRLSMLAQPALAPGAAPKVGPEAPLPQVHLLPFDPLRPPPEAISQASGTGFFATARGIVVTAAHVVGQCRAIRLVSPHLAATGAGILAIDTEHDIALLQAEVEAPAHLDIAPARANGAALVLGFAPDARHDAPAKATWARIVNDSFTVQAALERDPRTLLWMQTPEIAQGYSGGPILDAESGRVVGIVRALIDPQRAEAAYGIATPDLSIGPGVLPLRAMLGGAAAAEVRDDDVLLRARRATVRVVCWQ